MTGQLTRRQELALAAVSGVTVANAYYIHPIVSEVAAGFGVGPARIGIVPALNQIALALGIFLLLPLGDRFGNRTLALIFCAGQLLCLIAMALAQSFALFAAAATLLGFVTIVPYLLPAYASKRASAERLGQVTATLTVGVIAGILLARTGAGALAEEAGWRSVYWVAAALMALVTLTLPLTMEPRQQPAREVLHPSYPGLLLSVFALLRQYPEVLLSAAIQALNFGIFISMWLGLALHLTSPQMGYGVDVVGYLAGLAALSIYLTPRLGRWSDRVGARKARLRFACAQLAGVLLLYPFGHSLALLIIPITWLGAFGPAVDVTCRMTVLSLDPGARTRLMTAFVSIMFLGGGAASWLGTFAYAQWGWSGNAALALAMSALVVALSWRGTRLGA